MNITEGDTVLTTRGEVRNATLERLALVGLFLSIIVGYFYNLDGWLMHDDEGTDFYEVWRLQMGETPGVDFVAEQQPLFLLVGSAILDTFGHSPLPLRAMATVQVAVALIIFGLVSQHIFGARKAFLILGFTATAGIVYEQARLFRPDPLMFAWEVVGLSAALLAVKSKSRLWWALSGGSYGLSILWKLFGIFPVLGLVFYFLDRFRRVRLDWRQTLLDGISFALPFCIVSIGGSLLLYSQLGFYYGDVFVHHATMGRENGILLHVARNAWWFLSYLVAMPLLLALWGLWIANRRLPWPTSSASRLTKWQLASLVAFAFISREVYERYFIYLIPVLAILFSLQLSVTIRQISREHPRILSLAWPLAILLVFTSLASMRPSPAALAIRVENDSKRLASLVNGETQAQQLVVSDYATINFLAQRPSIRQASIIAGGRIHSGALTAQMLIEEIDSEKVEMILIHTEGGSPPPHQLIDLDDYDRFHDYINKHFELLTTFDRNGQEIEVFKRR